MKLEDALKYLRKGSTINLGDVSLAPNTTSCISVSARDLLSEDWEASLTDEQILKIWEDDLSLRVSTRQSAQAALLRDCIKLLRTRRL